MNRTTLPLFPLVALLAATDFVRAQNPLFSMTPFVVPTAAGSQLTWSLNGAVPHPFVVLADLGGGPFDFLGERFYLGFSPALASLVFVPSSPGPMQQTISVPPVVGLLGMAIHGQPAVFDAQSANGIFRTLNGASTMFLASAGVGSTFANPVAEGMTGSYRADVVGHIRGGDMRRRTHETIDPQGVPFVYGLANPLNPNGCREQMVFRTQDLGATGEAELITAIRWRPFGPVQPGSLQQFELRAGLTAAVPDYSIDSFSGLPISPNSGLDSSFASNYLAGAPPVRLYQGRYDVLPAALTASGYLPYPVSAPFAYDGVSSLLLEFLVPHDPQGVMGTGAQVRLMVQSSPLPGARLWASGTAWSPILIPNPSLVSQGTPDNAMAELEIEFVRVQTFAQSAWLDAGSASPDYQAPALAASMPVGTSVALAFRGSASASGANPTAWSTSPDIADGLQFLQFRMTFVGNLVTGEVPVVDTLIVPAL